MRHPSRFRELGVAALVVIALAGGSASASDAAAGTPRILLVSNRDGSTRGYSVRPDGSRLTPLLRRGKTLVPAALSGDGGTIAYNDKAGVYVSRANGTRVRLLVRAPAVAAALSRDGRMLAFTRSRPGIWIVGTDGRGLRRLTSGPDSSPAWSPDGKAIVFLTELGDDHEAIVVKALGGSRKVIGREGGPVEGLAWSPDGRWIGYIPWGEDDESEFNLWLVRSSGEDRHLVAPDVGTYSWSRDGKWLALTYGSSGKVAVIGADGRSRTLGLRGLDTSALSWAPDGRRLALAAAGQIWVVGRDGRGLRRVTSRGANNLVGWTRLAPVLPPARPIPKTERTVGRRTLVLRSAVTSIAAAGRRVAFITGPTATDCDHVAVWTPGKKTVWRSPPVPCGPREYVDPLSDVALTSVRVAWRREDCCGNYRGTFLITQSLLTGAVEDVADATIGREGGAGSLVGSAVGHESTLAFTVLSSTSRGALSTTVWRLGGVGSCPTIYSTAPSGCTEILKAEGEVSLLAVDARRIVVGTASGLRVLTTTGVDVGKLLVDAGAIALSGNRLAVQTPEAIEVYDLRSGARTRRFPTLSDLQDLEGDLLVAATSGGVPVVRSLRTGRQITFPAAGTALLERPGLFLTASGRITFTPMRELLRRLGG